MLDCSTIRLCRLYDNDKKTITISKFINYIEQNRKAIFNGDKESEILRIVQEDKLKFDGFSKKILGLKADRDTSLAHNDLCKLSDDFDMWAGKDIVIGDIHKLINFGSDVINHYSLYSSNTSHSIRAVNKLDVEDMLKILDHECHVVCPEWTVAKKGKVM